MRRRLVLAAISVAAFGFSALAFKVFVLDGGPLKAMGLPTPAVINWLLVLVLAAVSGTAAWRACTAPDQPTYGYGEGGRWEVHEVLPVIHRPTPAYTLWAATSALLMIHRGQHLPPPTPARRSHYRIRVKHSATSDIQTWYVSRATHIHLRRLAGRAWSQGRTVPVSSMLRIEP